MSTRIAIRPFRPQDQDQTRRLILTGLGEHFGFIDENVNPDLDDIARSYACDVFLLAWRGPHLVGTGALIRAGDGVGRLVRMSVDAAHRREGIGTLLLNHLVEGARALAYRRLVLETTETWDEVVAFYLRNGFRNRG